MERKSLFVAGLLFLALAVAFVIGEDIDSDVPLPKFTQNPTLKVLYCYSCGYRKAFDEYASIIQQKYPNMIIDGRNYDPPGLNMFLARALGLLKLLVIMCILGGVNIFTYMNLPQPSWWQWCLENKMYSVLMLFFLTNIVESQLIQSGAFEITLNDVPIWSKLETGRIPQPAELFQIIQSQMQFTADLNGGYPK